MVARQPMPRSGSEQLGEKIGEPARHKIGLGEAGRADDEVQRAHQSRDLVEIADRLLDPGEAVDAGLAGRLIGLVDRHLGADPAGMQGGAIRQVGHMAGQNEQIARAVKRLHLAIELAVIIHRRVAGRRLSCRGPAG